MRLCFIDWPKFVPFEKYEEAIGRMIEKLRRYEGVTSIYQVGGVSAPGISDVDMLVVFDNSATCNENPLSRLTRSDRYLFAHGLYGISRMYFQSVEQYTFFETYKLVYGANLQQPTVQLSLEEHKIVKKQVAIEYLVKMFINLSVARVYGIVSVRGLLLHVKAILKDLEFLDIPSGHLFELSQSMVHSRNDWFQNPLSEQQLVEWIRDFYNALTVFLRRMLSTCFLCIPEDADLSIARNIRLVPQNSVSCRHNGLKLPSILGRLGKRYVNVQHRFNEFEICLPIQTDKLPDIIVKRFQYIEEANTYNSQHIKHFIPVAYGLSVFRWSRNARKQQ